MPDTLVLDSYPGPLQDVLGQLVGNALHHAFGEQAERRLEIRARSVDGAAGPQVLITVSDNGCGIAAGALDKVFDPFFTTRLGGERLGLGLSAARNAVRGVLGGSLAVESTPGQGATFTLQIPCEAPQAG